MDCQSQVGVLKIMNGILVAVVLALASLVATFTIDLRTDMERVQKLLTCHHHFYHDPPDYSCDAWARSDGAEP